jgi:hypothetical protein
VSCPAVTAAVVFWLLKTFLDLGPVPESHVHQRGEHFVARLPGRVMQVVDDFGQLISDNRPHVEGPVPHRRPLLILARS